MTVKRFILCALLVLGASLARGGENATLGKVEFRELALIDALRMISEQSGLNITSSSEASKTSVSLFLRNVTADAAVEELCKSHNLWMKRDEKSGITRVMTIKEFERELVSFREDKTEVFTMLYPNAVEIAVAIRDLFGDRVELSMGVEDFEDSSRDLEDRFDRFDIIDQRSQGLGLFGGSGGSSFGGTSGSSSSFGGGSFVGGAGSNRFGGSSGSFGRGNNNLNRNRRSELSNETEAAARAARSDYQNLTADQAQTVQKLLQSPEGNVKSDAILQSLRRTPANIFVTLSRKNNLLMVRTGDQRAMDEIRTLIKRLDVPTAQVLLEVKVLGIELGNGFNSVFDYQFTDGRDNAGGFTTGDVLPPAADRLAGLARRTSSLGLAGTSLRAGDLTYQFVNDNFRARMQLMEDKNKVTVLATPLILTANNEVSRVFVGEERPIVRNISTQTIVNDNQVTSAPNTTIEFRPVGTTLLFTPNINSDRTVTLRLLQENSSINAGGATIPIVTGNGDVTNQAVDVVQTRTVSGTIVGKDQLCVAVGGLIEEQVRDQRSMVPGIGKVPVLGFFFRRQNSNRSRRELIVMIRPHIVSTPAEAEEISKKLGIELSVHPKFPDVKGSLDLFNRAEVIRPDPPENLKEHILKSHHDKQDDFKK